MGLKRLWNKITGKPPDIQALPPAYSTIPPTTADIGGYTGRVSTSPAGEISLTTGMSSQEKILNDILTAGQTKIGPTLFQTPEEQQAAADVIYNQIIGQAVPGLNTQLGEARALAEARALQSGTADSDISGRQFAGIEKAGQDALLQLYLQGRISADQFVQNRLQSRLSAFQGAETIKGQQFGRQQTALQMAQQQAQTTSGQQQGINAANEQARVAHEEARNKWFKDQALMAMGIATGVYTGGLPAAGGTGGWSLSNIGLGDLANIGKGMFGGGGTTPSQQPPAGTTQAPGQPGVPIDITGINSAIPPMRFNVNPQYAPQGYYLPPQFQVPEQYETPDLFIYKSQYGKKRFGSQLSGLPTGYENRV